MNKIQSAFTIFRQPRKTTFVTGVTGFLVGSAVIGLGSSPVILFEGERPKKLSIYDDPKPDIVLEESPTNLEKGIRRTRVQITQAASDLE
ncbi:17619_t:CDS:2, partial [Acaulospora morrowiae]